MKLIASSHELSKVSSVGGKGFHLQKLVSWGAPVSDFFILTTDCHSCFKRTGRLPEEVSKQIQEFIGDSKVAFRSSMIAEDQADSSFAGLFETILNVTQTNWQESLEKIYSSVHSDRVKEYMDRKKIHTDLLMGVVIQLQVDVEKSGVLFTRSPIEPTAALVIDAAWGMGEGVVSGHVEVDQYSYTRTFDLIHCRIQNEKQVLNENEAISLLQLGLQMEEKGGFPSDIEWGIKDGKVFLFQIRPITRNFNPIQFFVDTNLSESYPGTVSPFTAGFVKKAYENVFTESARAMGGTGEKLNRLQGHYKKLISSVDDHLYYNLEHYYAALRALPGGEKNIEDWHRMIGGKMDGVSVPYHETTLNRVESVLTLYQILKLALRRKKVFGALLTELEFLKKEIEGEIKNLYGSQSVINYLYHLINRPIGFGLTVVNDVFIMMGLGYFTKRFERLGINKDLIIDLLKTNEGVDSTKPLEHFNFLVRELSPEFIKVFLSENLRPGFRPYEEAFVRFKARGYKAEIDKLKGFLDVYGDRSFEELKLESLPLRNNPPLFLQLLTWAKENPAELKNKVQSDNTFKLGWLDRKILKFTRESIQTREATRLWRGKFYHLLRLLILKLGDELQREDRDFKRFDILDFFSISHHEWHAFRKGQISKAQVMEWMISRKTWQTKKQSYPEIIPWVEGERLPHLGHPVDGAAIKGQGVSNGEAEGIALVLENPEEALHTELKDFILVTKNTDPAWVYIMSRSQGLISEKGSLLSHTAIIGRELNIPTIVGVKHATQKIRSGERIRMNTVTGVIEKL